MNKKIKLISALIGLSSILYGCANPNQENKNSQTTVIIPQMEYTGGADNASYSEATIKVEGACLYFENKENKVLPIFATKEAYWNKEKAILVVDGQEYKDGTLIAYGGGEPSPIDVKYYTWITKPDSSCNLEKGIVINKLIAPINR
ncbi:hypothetical protein [Acinetobacter towneri]|jgi:hypothetical protein|uniref:hypothetical protein n=1 Tax=Acinetobacter towneri TaxID=202956 RepID=UPI003213DBE9